MTRTARTNGSGRSRARAIGIIACIATWSVVAAGCGDSGGGGSTTTPSTSTGTFVQVERLGRPAINEGLIITNDFLNAFNSIQPNLDLSDAAAAVRAEAVATIDAVDLADGANNVDTNAIATAFLPDVMRIDTALASPLGTAAYRGGDGLNTLGAPISGRKLEDDVMDLTLTVLVGATVSDGVPYARPTSGAGSTNPAIGHKLLNGQTAALGAATFPFLAAPN
jgi:hypothetical protein